MDQTWHFIHIISFTKTAKNGVWWTDRTHFHEWTFMYEIYSHCLLSIFMHESIEGIKPYMFLCLFRRFWIYVWKRHVWSIIEINSDGFRMELHIQSPCMSQECTCKLQRCELYTRGNFRLLSKPEIGQLPILNYTIFIPCHLVVNNEAFCLIPFTLVSYCISHNLITVVNPSLISIWI